MPLNCGAGEDSWESLDSKEIKEVNPKGKRTCKDWLEGLMLKLKLQYFGHQMQRAHWERLKAGREGYDTGQGSWMASPTQWRWVWTNSKRWWRTGKPGVLQFMGSQTVRSDLADWTITTKDDPPWQWLYLFSVYFVYSLLNPWCQEECLAIRSLRKILQMQYRWNI